jgi:hypothetical protein
MDLGLYARVLWRFKPIVIIGFIAAIGLAAFSFVKIGPHGITYRGSELWTSTTRVGVTQRGFPWGRLLAQQPARAGETNLSPAQEAERLGIPVADPNRLNNLAVLYAELANSDPIRAIMLRQGPIVGKILTNPLTQGNNNIMLPLIDIISIAPSQSGAVSLSQRAADALVSYVEDQQAASDVPSSDRVFVNVVERARQASVYQPRSKTLPVVVFLAVMFLTAALTLILENLRPAVRSSQGAVESVLAPQRKSA